MMLAGSVGSDGLYLRTGGESSSFRVAKAASEWPVGREDVWHQSMLPWSFSRVTSPCPKTLLRLDLRRGIEFRRANSSIRKSQFEVMIMFPGRTISVR